MEERHRTIGDEPEGSGAIEFRHIASSAEGAPTRPHEAAPWRLSSSAAPLDCLAQRARQVDIDGIEDRRARKRQSGDAHGEFEAGRGFRADLSSCAEYRRPLRAPDSSVSVCRRATR